jgi:hypothetical protein
MLTFLFESDYHKKLQLLPWILANILFIQKCNKNTIGYFREGWCYLTFNANYDKKLQQLPHILANTLFLQKCKETQQLTSGKGIVNCHLTMIVTK